MSQPEYTTEDLKELVKYIEEYKSDDEEADKNAKEKLEPLMKFLKANYFDDLVFPDWCEMNEEFFEVLYGEVIDLPLWVNSHDPAFEIIVNWRFAKLK